MADPTGGYSGKKHAIPPGTTVYRCASLAQLTKMAEQFIQDENKQAKNKDVKSLLNECIHILSNYKDQCKLLKGNYNLLLPSSSKDQDNAENGGRNAQKNIDKTTLQLLESAYIYYKIIHITILTRIPNLEEFKLIKLKIDSKKNKDLLEIYNGLVRTLLNDENIQQIKWFLKIYANPSHSNKLTNNNSNNNIHASNLPTTSPKSSSSSPPPSLPDSGSQIPMDFLNNELLKSEDHDSILFIDIRTRQNYNNSHIKFKNIICIEPISFKEMYSDYDLEKKSLITSPQFEINLFKQRSNFKFIILYTAADDKDDYLIKKQFMLLNILLNKSFEKPLIKDKTFVYTLNGGLQEWISNKGQTIKSVSQPLPKSKTTTTTAAASDNHHNNIYINGDTSKLNLKSFPKMTPGISHSMDKSMRDMMVSTSSMSSSPSPSPGSPLNNNESYKIMSRQSSSSGSLNDNLRRTSSLKRISQFLPNFSKNSNNNHSKSLSQSNVDTTTSRLSNINLYSNSTSAISLSPEHVPAYRSSPFKYGNNKSGNESPESYLNSVARYPETPHLQHMINENSNNNNNNISVPMKSASTPASPPQLPQLPKRIVLSPQNTSVSSSTIASPALLNKSLITNNAKTETLQKQFNLDFIVGLENMGNSCYLNCIIQCLLGTHELTKIFLNNSYEKHINLNSKLGSKGVLAKHFAKLINTMYNHYITANDFSDTERSRKKNKAKKAIPVRPTDFRVAIGSINSLFKDCSQQDCQEFCQFLLDGLHEDLNQNGGNPPLKELSKEAEDVREKLSLRIASSIEWERFLTTDFSVIVDLFQGQYSSRLQCKICNTTSTTYQPFSVLSIPVPQSTRLQSKNSCSIIDCFNEFTKIENLEVDEQWSCPHCKKKQPSTKKLTITRLPKNLIIHLKRFDNRLNKNNIMVNYPFTLDLTEFWADDFDGKLPTGVTNELPTRGQVPPFHYKLYGVACHFGSLYGGHYTAYVDKGVGKGWNYFDDTNVRAIKNDNEPITSNAYVLFYKRVYGGL